MGGKQLPLLGPMLQLGQAEHGCAFDAYVRAATQRRRLIALHCTSLCLLALGGGEPAQGAMALGVLAAAAPAPLRGAADVFAAIA
jgi:hypothetical protein|eukprot:COSAG01_NODE_3668_length_5811_cov_52.307598_11_plen_85_part_00